MALFPSAKQPNGQSVLIVGDVARWRAEGRLTPDLGLHRYVGIAALTPALFELLAPDLILSPLVADNFDVLELATTLQNLRFSGMYRALAQDIPNPDVIRAEVRENAPSLDFDVLELPLPR